MGGEAGDELVCSIQILKSRKCFEYKVNVITSSLAQSRDEENLKAAYEDVSRAGMVGSMIMMLFDSQIM